MKTIWKFTKFLYATAKKQVDGKFVDTTLRSYKVSNGLEVPLTSEIDAAAKKFKWIVDTGPSEKNPNYLAFGNFILKDNSLTFFDTPTNQFSVNTFDKEIEKDNIKNAVSVQTFSTFLVYKGKPIYEINWTATGILATLIAKDKGKDRILAPSADYEIIGGKIVTEFPKELDEALQSRFPKKK